MVWGVSILYPTAKILIYVLPVGRLQPVHPSGRSKYGRARIRGTDIRRRTCLSSSAFTELTYHSIALLLDPRTVLAALAKLPRVACRMRVDLTKPSMGD